MRSSVIKFLKMCKQFAEDYGSEIKNDENMIINTCYNNYKIILPNRTIKETIDLMKVIHQSAKDRFCVYLGKHTSKVTVEAEVEQSVAPKCGRKPLPAGFGKAEVYLACANYAKTEYVILSRIAVLSCFEHEVKELNMKNQMLQDAITAYNENSKNKSITVERKRAAYNPYITADEAQQLSINDIIKNVQEKQAVIQRRIDTKDERMQKRAERQKILAERAARREKRQLRKAQEAVEKAVKTVVAVA